MPVNFGIFTFDIAPIVLFFNQPVFSILFQMFAIAGWLYAAYGCVFVLLHFLEEYKTDKATENWKWVVLAVDMPLLNIQTPKAVEQLFAHLAGALDHANIAEKYRHGFKQRSFSFEIISIEGYIQFLIRTEESLRELVLAALYAQYPDIDVVEVEDYVATIPDHYPNETYDMWGADFGLAESDAFPIRTYREFEHSISKDTVLKDPMGTFLESFSRIGAGEQMWFQILIQPISNSWKEKAIAKLEEITGGGGHGHKESFIVSAVKSLGAGLVNDLKWQFTGAEYPEAEEGHGDEKGSMAPGAGSLVKGIEEKIQKLAFKVKMRGVYVARKEVFQPSRGVHALVGAINQYNIPSANSIVPVHGVSAHYFFKEKKTAHRKSHMISAYKKRKIGSHSCILNIEELATIWHFPMSHVKTPLLQRAKAKTVEPPAGLPIEGFGEAFGDSAAPLASSESTKTTYHADAGPDYHPDQKFG